MNSKLFKNGIRSALFAALVMTGGTALADSAPPLVWMHDINDRVEKQRIQKYGVGPYADATSRLETELQASIDLKKLPAARKLMAKVVKDNRAAARVFGKGHRVVQLSKAPRDVWDMYVDTKDGKLAAKGASLRIRIENGIAKINFKPPGAQRFSDGMAIRVESGINIRQLKNGKLDARLIKFLENTRLRDNPLREIPKLFPGMKARNFFNLQLEIKQKRNIYEVQQKQGSQWVKVSEVTLDNVVARDPAKKHSVNFGRVELEGEHLSLQLSANQQAALNGSTWRGPHKSSDTTNKAFTESDDVKHIRS
ncbi:MAG: CYTH domain-containing protein, partial [Deltaproteobacteria bacterium]|nr:CYTH domain-containing protein [Deltaproteobacteria bacterium]